MNSTSDDQRWRQQQQQQQQQQRAPPTSGLNPGQQRPQGGRGRSNPRDSSAYSSQTYNGSPSPNAWGTERPMSRNTNLQNQTGGPGYNEGHIPVRGFNSREVEEFLNRGYQEDLEAARSTDRPAGQKPVLYKSDKGWSTPKSSAWGSRPNAMGSGGNFLSQLRKGHAALQQNAAPAKE